MRFGKGRRPRPFAHCDSWREGNKFTQATKQVINIRRDSGGLGEKLFLDLENSSFAATTPAILERRGSARTSFSTNHHNNNNVLPIPHFKVRRRLYFHSIEHANITHAGASQSQPQANPRQKTELSTPFSPSQWVSQPPLFESTGKRKRKARVSRRVRRV